MNNNNQRLTQKIKFPFCLSDEEMVNPMDVFYSFCNNSNLRTETHRLDRVLEAISRSGYESNRLCHELVDTEYRRLIEASFILTERKTMEEISTERFLGLFAHEIKTQLAGASIAIEALVDKMDKLILCQTDFAYYLTSLKAILFNSNQVLSNMVTTVRFKEEDFSLRAVKESFKVADFLDDCTAPYHLMNETLNRKLLIEHSELQHKSIISDKIKLRQIIQNLLSNAYKYSRGTDVQLVVTDFADYITFSVISFGHTIPSEELEHILKLFYKVRPGGAGDGVGLYLCQVYTEILGGNIKVTSNKGVTSFTVSIPCEKFNNLG
ncbi:sensor histidine kinase KdpD [Chitinophaga sp. S165]|uniref:sensor histidine kinase n=1 Tax=Chitinophaga sp. S165 TaxID=2135462 RepID=UPI000D9195C9|nr:HAMP domain-containing sensor histidine kinase [Chitinophaga sp. S165]PWV46208.1 signal transduction histidine kinase [Chitinophaga sp. S165]